MGIPTSLGVGDSWPSGRSNPLERGGEGWQGGANSKGKPWKEEAGLMSTRAENKKKRGKENTHHVTLFNIVWPDDSHKKVVEEREVLLRREIP